MRIEPSFEIDVDGYTYIGRGPGLVGGTPGWVMGGNIFCRCAKCGSLEKARADYFSCSCGAMFSDADAGRFGSRFGDESILVYVKV